MFKKLAFLFSLLLVIPFGVTIAEAAKETTILYAEEEIQGEYHGYTYTENGINRHYDSPDFVPDIVTNFWAPSGYKFSLNYTDEQLNRVFDQAEGCGITYGYVDFILNYKKFGMNIYLESFINDFSGENARQDCIDWVKERFNTFRPFYEAKEVTIDTDISINIEFYFATQYSGITFYFEGETLEVKPFDAKEAINISTFCYDVAERDDRRITINSEITPGFFYEPPSYNEFGFHTDETEGHYIQTDTDYGYYDDCAKYKLTLFAYGTVEIGDLTYGAGLEVTYPSHPLTVSAKLEFTSGGIDYVFWSNEFVIGDPNISITIDGYNDRSSVQSFSEHDYALNFDTYDDREILSLTTRATAMPVRLYPNDNLIEYYDLAINPTIDTNYYLRGSFDDWNGPKDQYEFVKIDDNHYVLRNVPLEANDNVAVNLGYADRIFINESTWDNCYFEIDYIWDNLIITQSGLYNIDFYVEEANNNHVHFTRLSDIPTYTAPFKFSASSLSNALELKQYDMENNHYYLMDVTLNEGDVIGVSDSASHTFTNKENWDCSGFKIENDKIIITKTARYDIDFYIFSSIDASIILKERPLPKVGDPNLLYYVASPNEVLLHNQGKDEQFLSEPAGGQYVKWDATNGNYVNYEGVELLNFESSDLEEDNDDIDYLALAHNIAHIDYIGDWSIYHEFFAYTTLGQYYFESSLQKLEVSSRDKTGDYIVLKTPDSDEPLPDEINLLNGGNKIELVPHVPSHEEGIRYYYDYEIDKEGVVEVNEGSNGSLTLTTLNPGLVNITFSVECELFSKITKTISVRVLDAIYDVAKITFNDEFHYAGKDLTAYLSIRGFTRIQNINVDWTVTDKSGKEIEKAKLLVNRDATVTLTEPDSEDYTFTAFYEGVKLDELTVQVRYVDMNKFLRANIWWIFLITISFVALLLFLKFLLNRSKTTVENIERVYQVFCQCLSDDKLSKEELMKIKKEITKCMHRCEDLNIDALNQYEKATRYLRKSLFDCKALIRDYDTTTPADRGVYTDRLDKDLAKALNVAKEIENAKGLIESYHVNANRHNYEALDEGSKKNKNKK